MELTALRDRWMWQPAFDQPSRYPLTFNVFTYYDYQVFTLILLDF